MGMTEVLIIVVVLWLFGVFRRGGRSSSADLSGAQSAMRELQGQVDSTHAELEVQRQQLAELTERVDFAERRLVQIRDARALPPTTTP
jgi:hypothetical protein